jgi:hypothetical protein
MQEVAGSIERGAMGGFAKSEDGRSIAAVLWRSIQQFATFLLVTCHVVIAGTFMLLNFDA